MADDFSAVHDAAVGAATFAVDVPAGARFFSAYSSVDAYVHKTGVTAATGGTFIPAGQYVGWVGCGVMATGSTTELTFTAVTGNLAIVGITFQK